jgi:hypothetical protein
MKSFLQYITEMEDWNEQITADEHGNQYRVKDLYDYTQAKSIPTPDQDKSAVNATDTLVKTLPKIKDNSDVQRTLHVNNDQHYVVSSDADKTLVFRSNSQGNFAPGFPVHIGDAPQHGEKGFNITDHHNTTFQDFVKASTAFQDSLPKNK